jgi:hypothetical protein
MATKLGVSIANYVHRDLLASKPANLGVSEWVEELLVEGLTAKRTALEAADGPRRISTPVDCLPLDSLLLGLPIASGGVSWVTVESE